MWEKISRMEQERRISGSHIGDGAEHRATLYSAAVAVLDHAEGSMTTLAWWSPRRSSLASRSPW